MFGQLRLGQLGMLDQRGERRRSSHRMAFLRRPLRSSSSGKYRLGYVSGAKGEVADIFKRQLSRAAWQKQGSDDPFGEGWVRMVSPWE